MCTRPQKQAFDPMSSPAVEGIDINLAAADKKTESTPNDLQPRTQEIVTEGATQERSRSVSSSLVGKFESTTNDLARPPALSAHEQGAIPLIAKGMPFEGGSTGHGSLLICGANELPDTAAASDFEKKRAKTSSNDTALVDIAADAHGQGYESAEEEEDETHRRARRNREAAVRSRLRKNEQLKELEKKYEKQCLMLSKAIPFDSKIHDQGTALLNKARHEKDTIRALERELTMHGVAQSSRLRQLSGRGHH